MCSILTHESTHELQIAINDTPLWNEVMIVDRGMQLEGKDVHLYTHKHVYQL